MPRPGDSIRKRQRAAGVRYEARWREPDGTPRGKTFASHAEAKSHLLAVAHSKTTGTYVPKVQGQTPFRQVAAEWLDAKPRKARTVESYRHVIGTWLKPWLDRPVESIGYSDVTGLVARLRKAGRSPQTIHNVFNVAHGVLRYAVKARYIAVNPAAPVREDLPRREDAAERRPLTAAQVQALAALLPSHYGLFVRLAAWSGLRAGELTGLRVRRVNALRAEVQVTETVARLVGGSTPDTPKSRKSRRTVPIPASLARELGAFIEARSLGPDAYVFGDDDGAPLNHAAMYRRYFVPAAAAVGRADLHFHDLRHTYASLMAPHITMLELSRRLGHQTYALTANTYSHLYEQDDPEKAAALDALYSAAREA
jgi:integrase